MSKLPTLGRLYDGKPAVFVDTRKGIYWEVLPSVSGSVYRVQTAVLSKPSPPSTTWPAAVQIARRCVERLQAWATLQKALHRPVSLRGENR